MRRCCEVLALIGTVAASHIASAQIVQRPFADLTVGPAWQDVRGGDTKSRHGWSLAGATGQGIYPHLALVIQAGLAEFPSGVPQYGPNAGCSWIGPGPCPPGYNTTGRVTAVSVDAGLEGFAEVSGVRLFATVAPEADWLPTRDVRARGFAPGANASVGCSFRLGGGPRLVLRETTRRLFSSVYGPRSIRDLSIGVTGF